MTKHPVARLRGRQGVACGMPESGVLYFSALLYAASVRRAVSNQPHESPLSHPFPFQVRMRATV